MTARYYRLARRHAFYASLTTVLGVIAITLAVVGYASERFDIFFAGIAATISLGFVAVTQTLEAIRCAEIAAKWDMWDRRDLPQQDPQHRA